MQPDQPQGSPSGIQQPMQPYQPANNPYPPADGKLPVNLRKHHPWGLIISLILCILLLLGAIGFGIWAFGSRQNYKNNSDQISAKAVQLAIQQEDTKKDNDFTQKEKYPLKEYQGPSTYGSIDLSYPKTWSAYVVQTDGSALPLDAYFHPNFVPGVLSKTAYALHVQVTNQPYAQEMQQFQSKVKAGKLTSVPYSVKNVPSVKGSLVTGEINPGQQDTMVLMPIRDKTLKISSETTQFIDDFNNIILANVKFSP